MRAAAAVKQPQDETSKVAHLEGELIKNLMRTAEKFPNAPTAMMHRLRTDKLGYQGSKMEVEQRKICIMQLGDIMQLGSVNDAVAVAPCAFLMRRITAAPTNPFLIAQCTVLVPPDLAALNNHPAQKWENIRLQFFASIAVVWKILLLKPSLWKLGCDNRRRAGVEEKVRPTR